MKYLAKCTTTKTFMLNMLFTRLSLEYRSAFSTYAEDHQIETIEQFMDYISTQYESRKSIYQFMEQLDEVELKKGESLRDFATRLEEKVFELNTAVSAKFKELKTKKDPNFDGEMSKDDVFSLWAGMSMLKALQPDKGLYCHTITKADECFSALDLANIAEAYKERSQGDTMILLHAKGRSDNDNGRTGNNQRRVGPPGVCWNMHFDGKCEGKYKFKGKMIPCGFCKKREEGDKSGNGRNNQRNNRQNQGQRANAEPKPTDPEINYIRGAQVFGAGFR